MYRGTPPTFTFTLPIECETISKLSVAFKQGGELLFERGLPDVTMSGNVLSCTLTRRKRCSFAGTRNCKFSCALALDLPAWLHRCSVCRSARF